MNLRQKTIAAIAVTTVLLIAVVLMLSNKIILRSFSRLEDQNIRQNAQQAQRLLESEIQKLKSTLVDWAYWDDTYQFVADGNQAYIENNLTESAIGNLSVNFMVFTETSGRMVYGKAVDLSSGEPAVLPPTLVAYLNGSPRLTGLADQEVVGGVVLLPETAVLIASAPILNSLQEGPPRGRLILGRYFDDAEVKRMIEKLQLALRLYRFDRQNLPGRLKTVAAALSRNDRMVVNPVDDEAIEVYFLIEDINRQPVLFMGIDQTRAISAQGRASLRYFALFLILVGAVFMLVTVMLVERLVLAKLKRVSRQVKAIESTQSFKQRVELTGRDELAHLAADINKMLDALEESAERDRNILDNIVDGYCEVDLRGRLRFFNPALCQITGFTSDELANAPIIDFFPRPEVAKIRHYVRLCLAKRNPRGLLEGQLSAKSGALIDFEAAVSVIRNNRRRPVGFRGMIRDTTARKRNEARLVYLAYHDPLTGLCNRKAFLERLEKDIGYAARYQQPRTLLYIDLDQFKQVNDTFGHGVGDRLLKMAALRIRHELRDTDIVARMGGDEFTVLLTNPIAVSAPAVVQRLATAIAQPYEIDGHTIDFVSASIGIKRYPEDARDAASLIREADSDMYDAKNARKHSKITAFFDAHQQRVNR
jgi:diguanylate cyclase (GGDEF)-like protein/PAS domain S-box-containing protein